MTRPAWLEGHMWLCSYCGRRLSLTDTPATPFGPGEVFGPQTWHRDGERIVRTRPHAMGRRWDADGRRMEDEGVGLPTARFAKPVVAVCPNKDCGEEILLS